MTTRKPRNTPITGKQEKFCQAYMANGGKIKQAYIEAGYGQVHLAETKAYDLFKKKVIQSRIKELKIQADETIQRDKRFALSVEDRAAMLLRVYNLSTQTYCDKLGNERLENLNAAVSAVKELNNLLGTNKDKPDEGGLIINIIDAVAEQIEDHSDNFDEEDDNDAS